MDYKKLSQYAAIAVVAVWVFCLSFAVSMKIAKVNEPDPTSPPVIGTTTSTQGADVGGTAAPDSGITPGGTTNPLNIGANSPQQDLSQPTAPSSPQQGTPTTEPQAQPQGNTLKVPSGKSEIIKTYVDGVNTLKTSNNFSLYKDDKLNITIDSITGGSVVQSFAETLLANNQKQPLSYNFQNGYDAPTGATPASTIAPLGQLASIEESAITNATATANADGGYTVNLSFIDETQVYPGETYHHKNAVEVVDVYGLVPSGATIDTMEMTYSGTTIQAVFNSEGKITYMKHYLNVSHAGGQGHMSVFTMTISLHGEFTSEYTITY